MEVAEPCLICQAHSSACGCKGALVAYFSLLEGVQQRILREKPSSNTSHLPVAGAGIDKLNAYFPEPIKTDIVLARAKQCGYIVKPRFLKYQEPCLEIQGPSVIHLRLKFYDTLLTSLISNPNRFASWKTYFDFINNILPHEIIQKAQISRLDLNLDFACPFSTLNQSIDIKNKRSALTFLDESGKRTGVIIGKGKENIEIYDKAKKENLAGPLTRIELRLGKDKLPTRSISELQAAIQNREFFDGLEGLNLNFKETMLSGEQSPKLMEFKSTFFRDGFYSAKKSMNLSRNFDRDISKFVEIEKWEVQPNRLFQTHIRKFMDSEKCLNPMQPQFFAPV